MVSVPFGMYDVNAGTGTGRHSGRRAIGCSCFPALVLAHGC